MAQQISSRWTPFYKFVLPALVLGGMGFAAWTAYFHPEHLNGPDGFSRDYAWAILLVMSALMGGLFWWVGGAMVRMELDGDELIISNYRFEARVPVSKIESISDRSFTNPKRYTITFTDPTEFGRSVVLLPPMDWTLLGVDEAMAVAALRQAWMEARADSRGARESWSART